MRRRLLWRRRGMLVGVLAYGGVLTVSTYLLRRAAPGIAHQVLQAASTNPQRLEHDHYATLFTSAFLVQGSPSWYLVQVVLVLAAAGLVLGGRRLLWLFVLGHVGATVLVWGLLEADAVPGVTPDAVRTVVDVGPSYGMAAVTAAAVVLLAARPWRGVTGGAAVVVALAAVDIARPSVAGAGHVVAAALGTAAGALLARREVRSCLHWVSLLVQGPDQAADRQRRLAQVRVGRLPEQLWDGGGGGRAGIEVALSEGRS